MKEKTVLIVDDDPDICELVSMYLQKDGYETVVAHNGEKAWNIFRANEPDLILLDVIMSGMDGFEVCRKIREQSSVPVIFLTSQWESEDVVSALEMGGDDHIAKPFVPAVMVARVKSCLRRISREGSEDDVLKYGGLEIDRRLFEVRVQGKRIPLLAKEIKLFIFLAENPRQVFSAEQLYQQIWGSLAGDHRTVMVHISNVRKKLDHYAPGLCKIETFKGVGYKFVP